MIDISKNTLFKINAPYVVHETIEGETIAMNLRDGNYYSFDGIGPAIWELITLSVPLPELIRRLSETFQLPDEAIVGMTKPFIEELVENDLIIADSMENMKELMPEKLEFFREHCSGHTARKPVFHRYSDMRDILLLDPIHDVDAVGWPEPKQR
jgi:hypothetical protein